MRKLLLLSITLLSINVANAQWQQTSLNNFDVYCIAISGNNIFAGTDGGGVFLSSNNGNSWSPVNIGITHDTIYALTISGSDIYAATTGGMYLSTNNGGSWSEKNIGLIYNSLYGYRVGCIAVNGNNIFIGTTQNGIYLSTNNGNNWSAVNTGLPANTSVTALGIKNDSIFAGTFNSGGTYLSSNNGSSWTAVNNGLTDIIDGIGAFITNGNNIFAGYHLGIFLSSNNGSNWVAKDVGLTDFGNGIGAFAISGNNIFVGTEGGGVYLSSNNGSNWTDMNNGLIDTYVKALAMNGNYIFAGSFANGAGGVWKLSLSGLGIEENNNNNIIAVYPNPVINNLQIQTTLLIKEIEVTDITGRLLYTTTTKTINCSSFAKGAYFITLTTANGKAVKKFVKE